MVQCFLQASSKELFSTEISIKDVHYTWWAKNDGTVFDSRTSQCINQFAWFLARVHLNPILF